MGRRLKLAITVGGVGCLLLAGWWVYSTMLHGNAEGTIQSAHQPTLSATMPDKLQQLQYAQFRFPAIFQAEASQTASAPLLESISLVEHQGLTSQLSIQIRSLPSGALDDDGSYHYRRVSTGQYAMTTKQLGPNAATIFADQQAQNFSTTIFLQHQALDASIALTSGDNRDNTDDMQLLEQLVASWHWK